MKRYLTPLVLLTAFWGRAQTPVTPIAIPHITLFDQSGAACSLCKLYTYSAGTTTPLATYTDSTGTTQNTNPVNLDIAGGANIWIGPSSSYKFVLKTGAGATVWTVDNVKSSTGGLACAVPYAVQFANGTGSSVACDSTITIDPNSHALNVGGVITGSMFTLVNLSPVTSSWTFDVTSPATALASLGPIPLNSTATQAADTVVMNATGSTAKPTAVAMPSGCTTGLVYSTTSHTWGCVGTATQAADTVTMNATASTAPSAPVAMPSGCTNGINYNTGSHSWSCVANAQPSRVCNSYGCYIQFADGTIQEWISNQPCGSTMCAYVLPLALTSAANSSAVCSVNYSQGNITTVVTAFTTTSVTVSSNGEVNVGGSGYSYSGGGNYSCQIIGY